MIVSGAMFLGAVVTSPACYRRAKNTQWPTADGVVRSAGLKTYSHKPHRTPFFTPLVSYSYNVEGVPRVGAKINFADSKPVFSREEGMAWLERNYPIGKQVTVYYDPGDPDLAVLD